MRMHAREPTSAMLRRAGRAPRPPLPPRLFTVRELPEKSPPRVLKLVRWPPILEPRRPTSITHPLSVLKDPRLRRWRLLGRRQSWFTVASSVSTAMELRKLLSHRRR